MTDHPAKHDPSPGSASVSGPTPPDVDVESGSGLKARVKSWATRFHLEMETIEPVDLSRKTDKHYFKLFTLWFTMNFTLIGISTGMSGPLAFNMSFRDTSITALFFALLTAAPAAFFTTFGAHLGLRQMTHARYSFGPRLVALPILLNAATLTGYAIVGDILGAQALVAINPGSPRKSGSAPPLSIDGGIVIIAVLTLVIILFGARLLHLFDLYAWVPTFVSLIVALAFSGHHLAHPSVVASGSRYPPATAPIVLSYGCLIAGFFLPWAAIASDFTVYFAPTCRKTTVFFYSLAGLLLGAVPMIILGAAIGATVPLVPDWEAAYATNSVGGVLGAMLAPAGHGGKFLLFCLAMSVMGNAAGTLYALTLNVQAFVSLLWRSVHRVFFLITLTAIIIAVAIKAAESFLESLNNFLGIIAYWPAPFISVVLLEHYVFRRGQLDNYRISAWDKPHLMPTGGTACVASVASIGIIVPCMAQTWYEGPIAEHAGDIAFEMAFAVSALLYVPLRYWEIRKQGRL